MRFNMRDETLSESNANGILAQKDANVFDHRAVIYDLLSTIKEMRRELQCRGQQLNYMAEGLEQTADRIMNGKDLKELSHFDLLHAVTEIQRARTYRDAAGIVLREDRDEKVKA